MRLLCLVLVACGAPDPLEAAPSGADPVEAPPSEASSGALATPPADPVPAPAAKAWAPDDQQERALKLLSQRDPEPRCADVAALVDDPLETWRAIVAHVEMPPWVPMRAATCLLSEHPHEAEADALRWVVDEDKAGLTRLVLARLDAMPPDMAERVARRALEGPHRELTLTRLKQVRHPAVRALGEEPPPR